MKNKRNINKKVKGIAIKKPHNSKLSSLTHDAILLVKAAVEQNQHLKLENPNILSIIFGSMIVNGQNIPCVDIHINDSDSASIPSQLQVISNGKKSFVPVRVFNDISHATPHAGIGDTIYFGSLNTAPGTLGCILTDGTQQYMLTCCHVFTGGAWDNTYTGGISSPPPDHMQNKSGENLGPWAFGLMSVQFDIAYSNIPATTVCKKSNLGMPRDVTDTDVILHTAVTFIGGDSGSSSGFIQNINGTKTINYNGTHVSISNLIFISSTGPNNTFVAPSGPGDSGALVYVTTSKEPIGMLIAGDGQFSYVIPINSILNNIGLGIY